MKSIDYIIAIDFGMSNTKVYSWDIKTDKVSPVKLGKDVCGIIPTVVRLPKSDCLAINFFDKPQNMQEIGDKSAFEEFVKKLYKGIMSNNHNLNYNKKTDEGNYLVAISYPLNWSEKEGRELLEMVKNCIPSARYAIKQEEITLMKNSNREMDSSIVCSLNAQNFSYIITSETSNSSDSNESIQVFQHKGLGLNRIEIYVLGKVLDYINSNQTDGLDEELVNYIKNEKINEAEFFIRKKKELLLQREYADKQKAKGSLLCQWIEDAIDDYCIDMSKFLQDAKHSMYKETSGYKYGMNIEDYKFKITISIIGGPSDFIENTIKSVFPNADIKIEDVFCICKDMLEQVKDTYNETEKLFEKFKDELINPERNQKFLDDTASMVSVSLSRLCKQNENNSALFHNLQTYVVNNEKTSCNDFHLIINRFFTDDLCRLFSLEFCKEIENDYINIFNDLTKKIFSVFNDYKSISIENYFDFSIEPFNYYHDHLKKHMTQHVYSNMFSLFIESDLTRQRDDKKRRKGYLLFLDYLQNQRLVNSTPPISWILLENEYQCKLFLSDIYFLNTGILLSPTIYRKGEVNLNYLQNVIKYIFNSFSEDYPKQGLTPISIIKDKILSLNKFNFDTYLSVKRLIDEETISKSAQIIVNTLNIDNLENPILYDKILDFFNLSQEDINRCKEETENLSLYDIVEKKYLKYGIE